METDKKYIGGGILAVFVILASGFVSAFAVSSEWYAENPLVVYKGEVKDIYLTLQNLASVEDVKVRIDINTGNEILELIDSSDEYIIPGEGKTRVNLRVTVPNDANVDDVYPVSLRFTTVAESEAGAFGIGSSIGQRFDIVVREEPQVSAPEVKEPQLAPQIEKTTVLLAIVILIIIVIILWWFFKRKKQM